jgi:hypothetical protein
MGDSDKNDVLTRAFVRPGTEGDNHSPTLPAHREEVAL